MRRIKTISYLIVATLFLFGCNEILIDVDPPTSVPGETVLNSVDGIDALRASMYSKIRASFAYTTAYFVGASAYADETRSRPGTTRFNNLNVARDGDGSLQHPAYTADGGGAAPTTYNATYNIIQDANLLIGAVQEGILPEATYRRYRGEAYAIRAFAMHHLVRAVGYDPTNPMINQWNQGIIIRTEPTLDLADADLRERSTVQEVYAQILSDLSEAKTLLAGVNANNSYPTEAFVDGLTARVNLYAGNWAAALTAATNARNNSGRALQNTPIGVAGMFHEGRGNHPEALFKLVIHPTLEQIAGSNINNGTAAYTSNQWVPQLPTQKVIDLYEENDYRLGWYGDAIANQTHGVAATNANAVNDSGWTILKFNGNKGNLSDDHPYMRVAEMYLIQAEAAARTGSPSAGAPYLNELRQARGLGPVDGAALVNMQTFEDEILNERVRELVVEGHRFYDLKRLGRDVRNPDGTIKIRADSHRILAPIGATHWGVNPLIVENPGY
jgi:starch-binding outer membrane protein, SusD/RagB family